MKEIPSEAEVISHQLMLRAGLITPRTRELFEGIGVKINEDMSVLNAMEDERSDQNVLNEQGASY